jgi:SagB-type dehydrogenase family enzyme
MKGTVMKKKYSGAAKHFLINYSYFKFETSKPFVLQQQGNEESLEIESIPLSLKLLTQKEAIIALRKREWQEEQIWSTIMFYTLGYLRFDYQSSYAYHRGIPSPRCFYSTNLYWIPAKHSFIDKGVYRYDGLTHSMNVIQRKEVWRQLQDALPYEHDGVTDKATTSIILTTNFYKPSLLYGNFAYNLCTLEAGHAISQLQQFCYQLGIETKINYLFLDETIREITKCAPISEVPLAILSFTHQEQFYKNKYVISEIDLSSRESSLKVKKERSASQLQTEEMPKYKNHCRELLDLIEAGQIIDIATQNNKLASDTLLNEKPKFNSHKMSWELSDLIHSSQKRSSGNDVNGMVTAPSLIHKADVIAVVNKWKDLQEQFEHCEIEKIPFNLYLIVQHVSDLERGIYQLNHSKPDLELVYAKDLRTDMQRAFTVDAKKYNMASIPLLVFVTVDFDQILQTYGNRGYQMAQLKVGSIAHQFCLLASSMDWFCRPSKSYYDFAVEEILDTSEQIVYQLLVGKERNQCLSFDLNF